MSVFAVNYEYDATKRDLTAEIRPEHRAFLAKLKEADQLLASGPLGTSGALLIVVADDAAGALSLLDEDPFFKNNIVETRIARVWNPVIGPWQ
ncbi:MAG: YciI family protein [Ancrocorticia sp.]